MPGHRSVVLLVDDLRDPFWAGIAAGTEREAARQGCALVVASNGGSGEGERRALSLLRDGRVEGLLVPPSARIRAELTALRRACVPVVQIDRAAKGVGAPCVRTDHAQGSRLAVDYLVKRGHCRIVMLTGPDAEPPFRQRAQGFRAALDGHGIGSSRIIRVAHAGEYEGQSAVRALLAKPSKVTALYTANAALTVGALRALRDEGMEVPGDIDVVGFDDIAMGDLLRFAVTTVAQDVEAIGRIAFQTLMDVRAGLDVPAETLVAPGLIVR